MNQEQAEGLKNLLQRQQVAALGTLHNGEPFVSMVPYALLGDGAFVIHVSRLATHTKDMDQHAGVSLLVRSEREPDVSALGLARATVQGHATRCPPGARRHAAAQAAYLARFPDSEPMFGFADFSLFVIEVKSVRFVGGFAQAWSVTADDYLALMAAA